jgi:large subunit ribosomal protein L9
MAKSLKLLLTENVESLGIVGDVVNVRTGYARNFLLPRNLATTPSDELIKQLASKRAEAERQMALLRQQREETTGKLKGVEVTLTRSCNDMGILYGAVTQQDIASALVAQGFAVSPRDVRISATIKRVDNYDVHIKLDNDLDSIVKLHVKADRELSKETETESAGAAPAGAGAGGEGRRKDALSMALEEANKTGEKTGWGSNEKKAAADSDSGDKKKAGKKGDGEAKAEKPEKAEKKTEKKK